MQCADRGGRAVSRRASAAALLLGLWVRNPTGHECLSVVSFVCQVEVSASE